jgi:hypothetical protein
MLSAKSNTTGYTEEITTSSIYDVDYNGCYPTDPCIIIDEENYTRVLSAEDYAMRRFSVRSRFTKPFVTTQQRKIKRKQQKIARRRGRK